MIDEIIKRNVTLNARYMEEIMELRHCIVEDIEGEWLESVTEADGGLSDIWMIYSEGERIMDLKITELNGETRVKYLEVL